MRQIFRSNPATKINAAQADDKRGFIMVCMSALAFSTAGIFTKSVDASAWDIIFWRGISGATLTLLFLHARTGLKSEWQRFGKPALLAAILMASGTAAFIPAFKLTSVGNVALIWATAPFFCAVLAWLFIKEVPSAKVILCSGLALSGVAITMRGSFVSGHIAGDLLALWMTLMMAATMVVYRAKPGTPTRLPAALSAIILLPIALSVSAPSQVNTVEIGTLLVFGAVFAFASVLLAEGARLIPSAQAALVSALETPLAPVWAVLILSEWPSFATFSGGAIIMAAVVLSQRSTRNKNTTSVPNLNSHLRLDVGVDDAHCHVQTHWQDPIKLETHRRH